VIEALELGRRHGGREAVAALSFRVAPGEVVGLLGPNGAGKTTTLRMLAGTLAPTSGGARVGGYDVVADARRARARVGWLPERAPLYPDMTVRAQLRFAARLRGVGEAEVEAALAASDLREVAERRVGNLSRGLGQRVGIATATLHRPPVVLLDEPTAGLDPAQRVDLLARVRGLAQAGAAVILSTHVLAEVEDADRLLVIAGGRLRAEGTPGALGGGEALRVRVARPDGLAERLRALPGVRGVEPEGEAWRVWGDGDLRATVARVAVEHELLELVQPRRLEEAYLRLVEA
jgi:ABC-2 type transport system ATP-binding protein